MIVCALNRLLSEWILQTDHIFGLPSIFRSVNRSDGSRNCSQIGFKINIVWDHTIRFLSSESIFGNVHISMRLFHFQTFIYRISIEFNLKISKNHCASNIAPRIECTQHLKTDKILYRSIQ